MAVVGEDIPRELKRRRQWVAARITPDPDRPDKSNKRPIDPHTGGAASTTDASTWGAFEEAVAAAERLPAGTGAVGFVFTADDPYCGVDFDACYKDGRTSPEVLDWVRQLDSYTEKSISGLGLHVICKGVLPPGGRRKGGIEMYDRSRFFVMTGKAVPGLLWVNERNEALAKLHKAVFGEAQDTPPALAAPSAIAAKTVPTAPPDLAAPAVQGAPSARAKTPVLAAAAAQAGPASARPLSLAGDELLRRARSAAHGDAFDRLWRGDASAYPSHSEADLALACHLAFWTGGDLPRMDALFRQSGLYRPKWDQKHYGNGTTYGAATLDRALRLTTRFYAPGARPDVAALEPPEEPGWLEEDCFSPDQVPEEPDWLAVPGVAAAHPTGAVAGIPTGAAGNSTGAAGISARDAAGISARDAALTLTGASGSGAAAASPDLAEIPPLPAAAQLDPGLAAGAAPWLDAYIEFSRAWAPRAFDDFHEAVGLWLLSTVAARRVVTHLGPPRFTNIYIANVARSSIWTKTTAAGIGGDVLAEAGLRFLLAPDECTPQAYVVAAANTGRVDWERLSPEQDAQTRLEIGFAAQRGWAYDEFGMKVDAMMRDNGPMAEFRGLLRRFDDCPERYEYVTMGRGSAVMDRPYLALLASMTPADLARHARAGGPLWQDGFWARFAFVAPPVDATPALGRFPPGRRTPPPDLVRGLREWHEWLGVPEVIVTERAGDDSKVKTTEWDVFINRPEPRECTLGAGVEDAFYRYHDALTQLITEGGNPDWDGNYSRFAEKALRVASLLASMENHGLIELRHWARGQAVAERWRAGLHHVYAAVNSSAASPQVLAEEKILRIVRKLGQATVRDVLSNARDLTSLACSTTMEAMAKVGVLEVVRKTRIGTPVYAPARELERAG